MKKILIITQKVDREDSILGFFVGWIEQFARRCGHVHVICLYKGKYSLPGNVDVWSLGKESHQSRLSYIFRFYSKIWALRKEYDSVFVHMNPIYVVLGGLVWKLLNKRISMWYTHKEVDLKLKIAEKFADIIFTATRESFRIDSAKVNRIGHGIDVDAFERTAHNRPDDVFTLLHVGRITQIKNCDTLVRVLDILTKTWDRECRVVFAGAPARGADMEYAEQVKKLVRELSLTERVEFVGDVPHHTIAKLYAQAHVSVNLTPTGGTDKVVLESLASGVPVFASNKALAQVFGEYSDQFLFKERDHTDAAEKIKTFFTRADQEQIIRTLQEKIKKEYSVVTLIDKIVGTIYGSK